MRRLQEAPVRVEAPPKRSGCSVRGARRFPGPEGAAAVVVRQGSRRLCTGALQGAVLEDPSTSLAKGSGSAGIRPRRSTRWRRSVIADAILIEPRSRRRSEPKPRLISGPSGHLNSSPGSAGHDVTRGHPGPPTCSPRARVVGRPPPRFTMSRSARSAAQVVEPSCSGCPGHRRSRSPWVHQPGAGSPPWITGPLAMPWVMTAGRGIAVLDGRRRVTTEQGPVAAVARRSATGVQAGHDRRPGGPPTGRPVPGTAVRWIRPAGSRGGHERRRPRPPTGLYADEAGALGVSRPPGPGRAR